MKFFNRIDEIDPRLYEECVEKGTVERVDYNTTNYDGSPMEKHAYVYLPYGYDENKQYDILYLIHGGAESAEKYIYQNGEENPLKRAVDHMVAEKSIKPLIIVTPSPYPYHTVTDRGTPSKPFTSYFHNELVFDLIPAVESKYHTYADFRTSEEELKAVREHRGVMGWSMGCGTTWYVFLNRIAYFSKFGFLSGACGQIEGERNKEWADESAKYIVNSVKEQGFGRDTVDIYAITGTLDIAYEGLTLLMGALLAYPDTFEFYDKSRQNATFLTWPEGEHHTQWRLQYTINAIHQLFAE